MSDSSKKENTNFSYDESYKDRIYDQFMSSIFSIYFIDLFVSSYS